MNWNSSDVIALVALCVPLVQSLSSYFQTRLKVNSEKEDKANERREQRHEDRIKQMKETFEAYATITQQQISDSWHPFDANQRSLYLKVLLFTEGDFRKKLKSFDSICYHLGQADPKKKAFNKVIDSYCQFMKEQQDRRN